MRLLRGLRLFGASVVFIGAVSAQVNVEPILGLVDETSKPTLSPDGKTLAFNLSKPDFSCGIYVRPITGGEVRLLVGDFEKDGVPTSLRWSPDGKKITFVRAYAHYSNSLILRDYAGGPEKYLGLVCDRATDSSWSPDGRYFVASMYKQDPPHSFECQPVLFSAKTGRRIRRLAFRGEASAFSPVGRMLAYANENAVTVVRLTDDYRVAGPPKTIAREPREISEITWTPDGKRIIYQTWGDVPYLRRVAITSGARPEAIRGLDAQLSVTQLLPDGSALATETTETEALWRADLLSTPPKLETVATPDCALGAPGCSPDGRQRVYISMRTGISKILVANADGTNERNLIKAIPDFENPEDYGAPSLVGWSPDGKWIAFTVFPVHGNADTRTYLYVTPSSGGIARRLGSEAYSLNSPAWSRDSKSLYSHQGYFIDGRVHGSESKIVRVDIADGKITPLSAKGTWPRPSLDGKFLYFFPTRGRNPSRVSVDGGREELLLDSDDRNDLIYAIGAKYLYLFQMKDWGAGSNIRVIVRFDPESKLAVPLAEIPFSPRFAYLSSDERYLYFGEQDNPKRRPVMVHGLF